MPEPQNGSDAIQWSDEEGPRAYDSWSCNGGDEWHWHPNFVRDHEEAEDRIRYGLFGPDDVHPEVTSPGARTRSPEQAAQ